MPERRISPSDLMLCTLIAEPFDDPRWTFEPKLDGVRTLAAIGKTGEVELTSRNGKSQNASFPEIVAALGRAAPRDSVFDGELVALDERGEPSFRAMQQRLHLEAPADIEARRRAWPAVLHVFDVLVLLGEDVRDRPLEARRQLLAAAMAWSVEIRPVEAIPAEGVKFMDRACARHGEGIIGKKLGTPYRGGRGGEWVKVKCIRRQELVIGGFTDPQRSRVGIGALLVGVHEDGALVYAGKVGTGFSRDTLLDLRRRLGAREVRRSPFTRGDPPEGAGVHWVEPNLVAEIAFGEWTRHGLLRQPRFEGLRVDKPAAEVRRETPVAMSAVRPEAAPLAEYSAKRRFDVTPEPAGERASSAGKGRTFVVQEHHAKTLHYDFRLEHAGVLLSWAVPKEPSMNPSLKRLAVRTEAHPLEYARFRGDIPEGEYGAGHVDIWDQGTWEPLGERPVDEALRRGVLEIVLKGRRLKGAFTLVRTPARGRRESWLLIKKRDADAITTGAEGAGAATRVARGAAPEPKRIPARGRASDLAVTHADKVLFPEAGITKGEVIDYYRRVAPLLIPHLRDRPMTLERLPDGLQPGGPHFWQKRAPVHYPSFIPRVRLATEKGEPIDYLLVNDVDALLYLVNQGALSFHPWLSRVPDLDRPSYVLFDLDPGAAPFAHVVEIARVVGRELGAAGCEPQVKTSGKTGLHVLVRWAGRGGYDEARAWATKIANRVVSAADGLATTERSKAKRGDRVYIDVIQNARGHHVVPPYVLRPTLEATVSTPLMWKELSPSLDPARFTLRSIFRRLDRLASDPMADLVRPRAEPRGRRAA